jgi:hypothetical protein
MFCILSECLAHPPSFGVSVPGLWFKDENTPNLQTLVDSVEKVLQPFVAGIQMNPF